MSDQNVGFVTMGQARGPEGEIPTIGVGMLGYAFMGKAHTNALKKMPYIFWPPPAIPKLVAIAGRNQQATQEAARRYGYAKTYSDWRQLIADPEAVRHSRTYAEQAVERLLAYLEEIDNYRGTGRLYIP